MPLLEIHDLIKRYDSPTGEVHTVLDIPTFRLAKAEQVALQGTSGSGKTTLLNVIAGILGADSGDVRLNGTQLSELSEAERDSVRANQIGYVFQSFNLLHGYTALENVLLGMMFGPGPDREFAESLLERLGLKDRIDYRPSQLSIGQQQRVALARALANKPSLVLADEPTGNLDPHFAQEALDLIRELCREAGAGLLIVSHDQKILDQFERVVPLSEINRACADLGAEA